MNRRERAIRDILDKARAVMPSDEQDSAFIPIGAIIANAEDLLDEIEGDSRMAALRTWAP